MNTLLMATGSAWAAHVCVRGKVLFTDTAEPLPDVNMGISTSSVKFATLAIQTAPLTPSDGRNGWGERDGETEKKKHDK